VPTCHRRSPVAGPAQSGRTEHLAEGQARPRCGGGCRVDAGRSGLTASVEPDARYVDVLTHRARSRGRPRSLWSVTFGMRTYRPTDLEEGRRGRNRYRRLAGGTPPPHRCALVLPSVGDDVRMADESTHRPCSHWPFLVSWELAENGSGRPEGRPHAEVVGESTRSLPSRRPFRRRPRRRPSRACRR
jgi:hypothetical protein